LFAIWLLYFAVRLYGGDQTASILIIVDTPLLDRIKLLKCLSQSFRIEISKTLTPISKVLAMFKITSLALGLVTFLAIVPNAQAAIVKADLPSVNQPAASLHAQIIIKIGDTGSHHEGSEQRRSSELEQDREAAARRRAYYARRHRHSEYRHERSNNGNYGGSHEHSNRGEYNENNNHSERSEHHSDR
jgi:hypothetical protein